VSLRSEQAPHGCRPLLLVISDNRAVANEDRQGSHGARLTVRRFATNADADRHDAEYWRSLPHAERVLLAWRLSEEQWALRGEPTHEPGLRRPVTRLPRR
jgi:hypothetical protein